jgi:hypothetical protein
MNERIWDKFLTERDKAVFAAGGFGARAGFGKRPALLVIDVNWAFCGEWLTAPHPTRPKSSSGANQTLGTQARRAALDPRADLSAGTKRQI